MFNHSKVMLLRPVCNKDHSPIFSNSGLVPEITLYSDHSCHCFEPVNGRQFNFTLIRARQFISVSL